MRGARGGSGEWRGRDRKWRENGLKVHCGVSSLFQLETADLPRELKGAYPQNNSKAKAYSEILSGSGVLLLQAIVFITKRAWLSKRVVKRKSRVKQH